MSVKLRPGPNVIKLFTNVRNFIIFICDEKCFTTLTPEPNVTKIVTFVIYKYS
jgi:hypothetical protein